MRSPYVCIYEFEFKNDAIAKYPSKLELLLKLQT